MRDESKFMPRNPEEMEDFKTRLNKGGEMLTVGIKDLIVKIEGETDIKFILGLDKDNPFAIIPTWHPQNLKPYTVDAEPLEESTPKAE